MCAGMLRTELCRLGWASVCSELGRTLRVQAASRGSAVPAIMGVLVVCLKYAAQYATTTASRMPLGSATVAVVLHHGSRH